MKPKKKELQVNIFGLIMGFAGVAGIFLWIWLQQFIWFSGCVCNYWIGGGCIDSFGNLMLLTPYLLSFSFAFGGFRTAFYRE